MDAKKTVTLIVSMVLCVAVFFRVPVYAAYSGAPVVSKSDTSTVDGVQVSVRLDQYYPVSEAQSGAAALEYNTMFYYRLYNTNDQDAYITNTGFLPQWVTAPYSIGYECYTEDLKLAYQSDTGRWYVYASSDFVYNTGIIVPAHTSLCCVGVITGTGQVSNNGNTLVTQVLSSVSLTPASVTLGTYQHGTYSNSLEDIEELLLNISDQLSFSGTITNPLINTIKYEQKQFSTTGFTNFFYITRQPSFVLHDELVTLTNNSYYQTLVRVIPIYYRVRTNNTNTVKSLKFDYSNLYTPLYLPKLNQSVDYIVGDCVSQVFDKPVLDFSGDTYVRLQLPFKYTEDGHGLLPPGNFFTSFVIYAVLKDNTNPNSYFPSATNWQLQEDNTFTIVDGNFYLNDTFYLRDLNDKFSDFLDAYSAQSGQNTEDLNNAHTAEQNYFEANSQALANSGVSNPNFEASDRTGINSAIAGNKNTFGLLWNAIGAWRNVYIYAAMMTLVTYLLRHRPWASAGFSKASHWFNRMSGGDQG